MQLFDEHSAEVHQNVFKRDDLFSKVQSLTLKSGCMVNYHAVQQYGVDKYFLCFVICMCFSEIC